MLTTALIVEANMSPIIRSETELFTRMEAKPTIDKTTKLPRAALVTNSQSLAKSGIPKYIPKLNPRKMTKATPSPAPELIPRIKGPAMGFLKKVCICRPLIPRALPTSNEVRAFGRRKLKRIDCHPTFSICCPIRNLIV